jgi:hypothetical protein
MRGTKLVLTQQGMKMSRLFGSKSYAWSEIEDIRIIAPTNTFGDNPLLEPGKRIGLGLFVANSSKVRDNEFDADVVLCAGGAPHADRLMSLVERLKSARTASGSAAGGRKPGAARRGKFGTKDGGFSRRASAAAAANGADG